MTARFKAGSTEHRARARSRLRGPALARADRWARCGIGATIACSPASAILRRARRRRVESRYRGDIYRAEALWYTPRRRPADARRCAAASRGASTTPTTCAAARRSRPRTAPRPRRARRAACPIPCTDPALVPGFDVDRRLLYERARLALDLRPRGPRPQRRRARAGRERRVTGSRRPQPSRAPGLRRRRRRSAASIARCCSGSWPPWSSRSGCAPIPFDEMISPCGALGIRGLPDGLLRDRSGLVGTAEYRWLISSAHRRVAVRRRGRGGGPLVRRPARRELSHHASAPACASTGSDQRALLGGRPAPGPAGRLGAGPGGSPAADGGAVLNAASRAVARAR